jgi:probable O-glycosylation ligase (exosortase A-associated)
MRDLLLIAIVSGCTLLALRLPVFGLLCVIAFGFLNPHSMTWTIGRTLRHSLMLGVATIIGFLLWSEDKKFPRQRELLLLLMLWGVFSISTIFAIKPDESVQRFVYISKILTIVFLSTSLINNSYKLHLLLHALALSLGFFGLKGGIFSLITGMNYLVLGPEESFIASRNAIGLAMVMNIPLLLYLLKFNTNRWWRVIIGSMLIFSYPAVISTYSRGAWLGLGMVTFSMILQSKYKVKLLMLSSVVMIVAFPVFVQYLPGKVVERYNSLVNYEEDASAESRFWNWEFCKRVGLANPLTGGGFDFQSQETYVHYFPEFLERWPGKEWSCHSAWFTIFSEHGFPGLILWTSLLASCFVSLRGMRAYGRAGADKAWIAECAKMLQSAFAAFLVVGTFYDAAYFDLVYYLVAVIVIIKEILQQVPAERVAAARATGLDKDPMVEVG